MEAEGTETVRLNVGGTSFKCFRHTLNTFENSRLARLDKTSTNYDPFSQEFFYDRNPHLFNYILDAYRTGTVHLPKDVCGINFRAEMEFWGISTQYVSPCCWVALYGAEENMKTADVLEKFYRGSTGLGIMSGQKISVRNRIWLFLYEPKSSTYAMVYAVFVSLVIVVSVLVSAVESLPVVYTDKYTPDEVRTMKKLYQILGWMNTSTYQEYLYSKASIAIPATDAACFSLLTIDMILCAMFCPNKLQLLKSWIHVAEIVCTISFWLSFGLEICLGDLESTTLIYVFILLKYATVLKLVRLLRVARNIPALKIMGLTLDVSKTEIAVMGLMMFMFSSFFGTLIYLFEMPVQGEFENIFSAMYWAVITLTTVGYGDYTPKSTGGHVIAGTCAVCGILMLAIPIGIIASEYMNYYSHHKYARYYLADACREGVPGRRASRGQNPGGGEGGGGPQLKRLFSYNKKLHT